MTTAKRLAQELLEDVALLRRDVPNVRVAPTPFVIRSVISTILYKWIGEGRGIYQLQKDLAKKIQVPTLNFDVPIRFCEDGRFKMWLGPLALFDCSIGAIDSGDSFEPSGFDPNSMSDIELSVKNFFDQKIAFVDQSFITRREVIGYARNKGGAHLTDGKRKEPLESFRLIQGIIFDRAKNMATVTGGRTLDVAQEDVLLREGAYDCVQIAVLDSTRRFIAGVDGISESLKMLAQEKAS